MTWSRFSRYIALSVILTMFIVSMAIVHTRSSVPEKTSSTPSIQAAPSGTVSLKTLWDSVISNVDQTKIQDMVKTISTNYPQRTWYPLYRDGSTNLRAAWTWANETLSSATGGNLHFEFMSEMRDLVAVKEGTDASKFPIVIGGIIASQYSPGANGFASSVAAVIETARVLNSYSLSNDVYFVLSNTITSGYAQGYNIGNQGIEYLLTYLEQTGRPAAALIWYNRLLYDQGTYGNRVKLDYDYLASPYDPVRYLMQTAIEIGTASIGSPILIANQSSGNSWATSGAYAAWKDGVPSIALGQFEWDGYWSTSDDTWDKSFYDYSLARRAVCFAASLILTLGSLHGNAPVLTTVQTVASGTYYDIDMPLTGLGFVNVSVTWDKSCDVLAQIRTSTGSTVYTRNESNQDIHMSYLVSTRGNYRLRVTNLGNESISATMSYAQYQDFDFDNLDDHQEALYGTNSLSNDTDLDLLSDGNEIAMGTNPLLNDTDGDGALDGVEVLFGCNPLVRDTDGDGLLDGFEIEHGYNATSSDSDRDGLADGLEVSLGTNPLSNDTDRDGLSDYTEYILGTNPLSPDSDNDSLSDLFEVLNGLNPLSADTDGDGLSDSYEIAHCLMPNNPDTDGDGIPDGADWAPKEHWITIIPPLALIALIIGMMGVLFSKRRTYLSGVGGYQRSSYAKENAFNPQGGDV
jgi:hypothetical protein